MTRRELLLAGLGAVVSPRVVPLATALAGKRRVKFAVITDLHHGLAPDAMGRLSAFVEAVGARQDLDFVLQMGDYCYSQPDSHDCVNLFETIKLPKIHVLGNHDMDKVDKDGAMRFFGMRSRFGSRVVGGWRFVWLDLNNFRKDGELVAYKNGNYFTDGAACNYADPEQLSWLAAELKSSREPVILISHQPLGFKEPGKEMPAEQVEVLNVIDSVPGKVAAMLCGHMHVDRLEMHGAIPCLCVNSASYFWWEGMRKYSKPLFAFMRLDPAGFLTVEGASGEFVSTPPASSDGVLGRSASISDRRLQTQVPS